MVHKMKKEFMELEAQARKMEVFVDYEPAAPVGSLFAMKCVVSDKKGARIKCYPGSEPGKSGCWRK